MKELSKKDLEKYLMFLLSRENGKLVQITTSNSPILVSFPEIAILAEWTMYPDESSFINISLAIMSGDKYKLNLIVGTCSTAVSEKKNMKSRDILYSPEMNIDKIKNSFTVVANLAEQEYGLNESDLGNSSISEIAEEIISFYNKAPLNIIKRTNMMRATRGVLREKLGKEFKKDYTNWTKIIKDNSGESYSTFVSPKFLISYGHVVIITQFALSNDVLGGGHFINLESFYNTIFPASAVNANSYIAMKEKAVAGPSQTEFTITGECDIPYATEGFELGIMISMVDKTLDDLCIGIIDIADKSHLNDFDGEVITVGVIPDDKPFRASKYDIMRMHDESATERIKLIIASQKSKKKSSDTEEAMKDAGIRKFINAMDAHVTELNAGVSIVKDLKTGNNCTAFILSIPDISLPTNASADIVVAVTDYKCMMYAVVRDHTFNIHDKISEFIQVSPIIDAEDSSAADIKIRSERVESVVDHIIKGVLTLHVNMLEKRVAQKEAKADNNKLSDEKKNEDLKCEYEKSMDDLIMHLVIGTGYHECNFAESIKLSSLHSPNLGPVPNVNIKNLYPQFFGRMVDSNPTGFDTFDGDTICLIPLNKNKKKPW